MKTVLYKAPDGRIIIRTIVADTKNETVDEIKARLLAKGKLTEDTFIGVFDQSPLTPIDQRYEDARRFSAGAVVVKMGIASLIRWGELQREARQKLRATDETMQAVIEAGTSAPLLTAYRARLREVVRTRPLGLESAVDLAGLDAVRPSVLDEPMP